MEQQVINHLVFEEADTRVVNQTSNEGKRQMKDLGKTEKTDEQPKESTVKEHKNADAFLIYMAFRCEGDDEYETTQTISQEENPVCEKQTKFTGKRSPNTSLSNAKEVAIKKRKRQSPVTSRHSHRVLHDKPTFSKLSDNDRERLRQYRRNPANEDKTHTCMSTNKKPQPPRKTSFISLYSMDTQGKKR